MPKSRIKRALISVYDKTGIIDFARALTDELAMEIISTGGTAALLKENNIPVTLVEKITGSPEMMDGRVKTLHPKIHAAILADRDNPEHMRQLQEQGIKPIDMVVVNLYPFAETVADPSCTMAQAIEMIDIGGPCLLRAAAKNYKHVLVIPDTKLCKTLLPDLRKGSIDQGQRLQAALAAFQATCTYDAAVAQYLTKHAGMEAGQLKLLLLSKITELRYGENPHQRGDLFCTMPGMTDEPRPADGLVSAAAGSTMSFNNYADGTAALELCRELTRGLAPGRKNSYTAVFIKHSNACGAGIADDPGKAYQRAYLGDPQAAMGGVLACSFDVDGEFAQAVMETYDRWGKGVGAGGFFVEVWIAPRFDDEALQIIKTTKKWGARVRLLRVADTSATADDEELDYRKITGGMLVQSRDLVGLDEERWTVVTKRSPADSEMADLRLAWLVCKHTKSNAITICKDGMLIGNGAGQMSRVMSCRIATWLANENGHADKLAGSVAASDAFFPFPDGPNILIDAGVTAIIQPGGSKRDRDTIAACDARGVVMIFTGTRHFRH